MNTKHLSLSNPKEKNAALLNVLISILIAILVVPYLFQFLCQTLVKFFLWPLDLINFNGKWTYRLAFPNDYQNDEPNQA